MVAGKTQVAAAVAVVAFAGSAYAAPAMDNQRLVARMDRIVKAGAKLVGHVAKDSAHGTAVDHANDYLKDKFGAKPQPLHPDLAAALKKQTGPHDPKLVAAAIGHLPGHSTKKRELEDAVEDLLARGYSDDEVYELIARMDKVIKAGAKVIGHVAKDSAHGTVVDQANDYLKDKFGPKPQPISAAAAAALKKHTGPHDPALVAAAIGKKKREFDDELVARMDRIVKAGAKLVGHVAKDSAHGTVVDHANDYLKDKFGAKPQPLHPDLAAALKKATGPHDPKIVAAAIGKKRRALEDELEELLARAFDDEEYELAARMDRIVKAGAKLVGHVAKDTAHGNAVDHVTDYIKDKIGPKPQPLHPDAVAAIKKMTGPHDPKLVAAAIGHLPGHSTKKRELEGDLEDLLARGYIDDEAYELVARMDKIVKAGAKLIGHVAKDSAHGTAVDHANDYLKDKFGAKPQPLHPDLAAALKKATGPHDPKIVAAAIGKKRRSFEDDIYEIFARGYEVDDLE